MSDKIKRCNAGCFTPVLMGDTCHPCEVKLAAAAIASGFTIRDGVVVIVCHYKRSFIRSMTGDDPGEIPCFSDCKKCHGTGLVVAKGEHK